MKNGPLNKIIWTYWDQGFENAPIIVEKCLEKIININPTWDVKTLDRNNIYEYIDPISQLESKWEMLSLNHRSDLLRLQLLTKYGGVWMDPTVYCMIPLKDWLPECLGSGVFLFSRPGPDRIISSWFIAAEPNNYLLKRLNIELINHWHGNRYFYYGNNNSRYEKIFNRIINGRSLELSQIWLSALFIKVFRVYPYMLIHYMFYKLLKTDPHCKKIWDLTPKISASTPHALQRLGLANPLDHDSKSLIDNGNVPLFKLNWKVQQGDNISGDSILGYLFKHTS